MCADKSTVYTAALSLNELNVKHKKELKLVSDWVTNNTSIITGSIYQPKAKVTLTLNSNNIPTEQVQ